MKLQYRYNAVNSLYHSGIYMQGTTLKYGYRAVLVFKLIKFSSFSIN